MRKAVLSLSLLLFTIGIASAYYDENTLHNVDILKAQGYSDSTIQMVDVVTNSNLGAGAKRRRIYKLKKENPLKHAYTTLKNYVDPLQDDGAFGEHQINFTNTWNGDVPKYAERYTMDHDVENL